MAARKGGLGRGLDALLPSEGPVIGFASIAIDHISPNPQQPRANFDDDSLSDLAASIREVGLLQPVIVRSVGEGEYHLVAGERRWRAARLAGLTEIPAVVREGDGDDADLTEALIENIHRENLGPLEEAGAYRHLMEDYGLTHDAIASRVGKSRVTITNALRLLQLPAAIQGMLERGELAAGHARALLGIDDEAYALHIARQASTEGWSVRQVEEAARLRAGESKPRRSGIKEPRPAAIIELEEQLTERLGSPVKIDFRNDKGKVVVRFGSLDELERLYRILFGSG
jgi:ParB family chromosome partitioning protein